MTTLSCSALSEKVTTVAVHPSEAGPPLELAKVLGTNVALWHEPSVLNDTRLQAYLGQWSPGLVRLPGGSWSNEYFWNGHGVRLGPDRLDPTALQNGQWQVDYSNYAPGFRVHGTELHLSDYHGVLDVLAQHTLAESMGAAQMVTVNLGTGTPEMAAEWLKFTRERGFNVPYWELGNELNGQWETGHFLKDGSGMTGELYAQRFLTFAQALKSVDPKAKVGGPACSDLNLAFVEALLRDAGKSVDFVSLHAYPVGVQRRRTDAKFADIAQLRVALRQLKDWIQKYQPKRAAEIEIAITEWHMKVNEDRDTADLISGLWSAAWIGTMLEGGVSLANQWDLLTQTETGGHGAFYHSAGKIVPKPHYWAHYLWGQFMGNRLVPTTVEERDGLEIFTTRTDEAFQVMIINPSEHQSRRVGVAFPADTVFAHDGRRITFSSHEYIWDPHAHRPIYSAPPTVTRLKIGKKNTVSVPPFSITVLELPLEGRVARAQITPSAEETLSLRLITPEKTAADLPVEIIVVAWDTRHDAPSRGSVDAITLELRGPVAEKSVRVPLRQSVGRYFLKAESAGRVDLVATLKNESVQASIDLQAIDMRPELIWTFEEPMEEWGASGTFEVAMEPSVKPNGNVASSRLHRARPGPNEDVLIQFEKIPESLPRHRIGGLFGEVQASPALTTKDENAQVNVIGQSEADHWMVLGSIPLQKMLGEWVHFRFEMDDPQHLEAMARLYALRFQLESEASVTGDIYFDNIGFLLRSAE